MSDHLSDEQNAYNAAYIKGRRDMAAEFEAAERALVERLEEVEEVCDEWVDFERGGGPWTRPHDTLEEAVRAAPAGDSSHSGTGGEPAALCHCGDGLCTCAYPEPPRCPECSSDEDDEDEMDYDDPTNWCSACGVTLGGCAEHRAPGLAAPGATRGEGESDE